MPTTPNDLGGAKVLRSHARIPIFSFVRKMASMVRIAEVKQTKREIRWLRTLERFTRVSHSSTGASLSRPCSLQFQLGTQAIEITAYGRHSECSAGAPERNAAVPSFD